MQSLSCSRCHGTVFFENRHCGQCGATLGFVPSLLRMGAFDLGDGQTDGWVGLGELEGRRLQPCANRLQHDVCNWMVDEGDSGPLCRSCRLTTRIPALSEPRNVERWRKVEQAKRRLMYSLICIGLNPEPKRGPDDKSGLAFHLLAGQPDQSAVMTGHNEGVITINVEEADDVQREMARVSMNEPVRNLLGHLRHEMAHYLQHRYIDGTPAIDECRVAFGDDRDDYAAALKRHYDAGPPPGWQQQYISAYASAHPWEDWAETCAHYLLALDAVQTATAWGLALDGPASAEPATLDASTPPRIDELVLRQWLPVAQFLNAMNRSLGQRDAYPYLMPPDVLAKMGMVQRLLHAAADPA